MTANAIFHSPRESEIVSFWADDVSNCVYIGFSDGRILKANAAYSNSRATGQRSVSAVVANGVGAMSQEAMMEVFYRCHMAIAEVDDNKVTTKTWEVNAAAFSAMAGASAEASFVSPILYAGTDLTAWGALSWSSQLPDDTSIKIGVRAGRTEAEASAADWKVWTDDGGGAQSVSLADIDNTKPYIQIRASLSSLSRLATPSLAVVSASYRKSHTVYFFTTKMSLADGTKPDSAIIVANMDVPRNTKITFGVTDKNTADWDEYVEVEREKVFGTGWMSGDKVKVGVKIVALSPDSFATIDEFAVMVGGEKLQIVEASNG